MWRGFLTCGVSRNQQILKSSGVAGAIGAAGVKLKDAPTPPAPGATYMRTRRFLRAKN